MNETMITKTSFSTRLTNLDNGRSADPAYPTTLIRRIAAMPLERYLEDDDDSLEKLTKLCVESDFAYRKSTPAGITPRTTVAHAAAAIRRVMGIRWRNAEHGSFCPQCGVSSFYEDINDAIEALTKPLQHREPEPSLSYGRQLPDLDLDMVFDPDATVPDDSAEVVLNDATVDADPVDDTPADDPDDRSDDDPSLPELASRLALDEWFDVFVTLCGGETIRPLRDAAHRVFGPDDEEDAPSLGKTVGFYWSWTRRRFSRSADNRLWRERLKATMELEFDLTDESDGGIADLFCNDDPGTCGRRDRDPDHIMRSMGVDMCTSMDVLAVVAPMAMLDGLHS